MKKITNIKVGVEFDRLLAAHPAFAGDKYKLISPCHYFLNTINEVGVLNDCKYVSFHSKRIKAIFRAHHQPYGPYLKALEELGLLERRRCYINDARNPERNRCNEYKVTELGKRLLRAEVQDYLRKLHDDPQARHSVQKSRSKNKTKAVSTGDVAVDSMRQSLFELKLVPKKFDAIMAGKKFSNGQLDNIGYTLMRFYRGDFGHIERNPTDGRIHHLWVQMNSEVRAAFRLGKANRTHVMDIRSCHPTFWATYVYKIFRDSQDAASTIRNTTKEPTSILSKPGGKGVGISTDYILPHYVGVDGDILMAERDRWVAFWTSTDADPKELIAREIGITRCEVKHLINSALNSSENRLRTWMAVNYPNLFKIWLATPLDKTGNNIAKLYESDIMHNPAVFEFAESLGIKIMTEHDGLSVFSQPDDEELEGKVKRLEEFLKNYSLQKHGVPIVLKTTRVCALN